MFVQALEDERIRLQHLMTNLIVNALQAMETLRTASSDLRHPPRL
jgi:C4-dicarboxylate-specific signal transduction histidine kinase